MRSQIVPFSSNTSQHGFSMLEILITLVIIAIAMLGTAGLQINALRLNKGSQMRTQAIFLASDIAERMEANKAEAILGSYALSSTSSAGAASTLCDTAACDSSSLAAWDIFQWSNGIIASGLPQATWSITHDTTGNPSTYSIVISWIDRGDAKTATSTTIQDSYTATRTIGN